MTFASLSAAVAGSLCIFLLAGCGRSGVPASNPSAEQGPARKVQVAYAEMRPMVRAIRFTGSLAPQEASTLSTKVSGRLHILQVDIGSLVRKGDLVCQVEPRDYELRLNQAAAALAQARAAVGLPLDGESDTANPEMISSVRQAKAVLEEAARSLERARSLTESRIVSASELDTAEAAHQVALMRHEGALEDAQARLAALAQRRAELEIARKQLSDTSMLAPFDGAIQARLAGLGEYVATGTPIVRLVQTDPLRLRLEVPERESVLVRPGQPVRLKVEGMTNFFAGFIARLSPALNETNRMLLVEADVPSQGALRAGLFARAEIVINENEEGLSVPANALVTFAGIEKVITVYDGKALEKTVTTGRRGPGWIEVLSGVTVGAPVVLDPGGLRSGQAVTVQEPAEQLQTGAGTIRLTRR